MNDIILGGVGICLLLMVGMTVIGMGFMLYAGIREYLDATKRPPGSPPPPYIGPF